LTSAAALPRLDSQSSHFTIGAGHERVHLTDEPRFSALCIHPSAFASAWL
jgi:hypothetical protein